MMKAQTDDHITTARDLRAEVAAEGYTLLLAGELCLSAEARESLARLRGDWADLPPDEYLADGGSYRFRRHGRFSLEPETGRLSRSPQSYYYQSGEINGFAGGIKREFPPLSDGAFENLFLRELVRFNFYHLPVPAGSLRGVWTVDVHIVRVVATADEPGKPTPEGIHCDGFDFVTFHVVDRVNVTGGENIVYAKDETPLLRRTLLDPWDSILADDSRVLHYTTEVRPCDGEVGHRDMLLMSYHCR